MATRMNEVLMMVALLIDGDCNIYMDNETKTCEKIAWSLTMHNSHY